MKSVLEQLKNKEEHLKRSASVRISYIDNQELKDRQREKRENAKLFLSEISEIIAFVGSLENEKDIKLVPMQTMEKQCEKADFCSYTFDGEFCKLVLIQNFLYDDIWLLNVKPVTSI